jgi:hypothetical protein
MSHFCLAVAKVGNYFFIYANKIEIYFLFF